jgi:transcriptional regulator with PAS, ATPase and Fis domain
MTNNILSIKQRFGIIGRTKILDNAIDTASRVSATDLSVLITGESGVGKEVFSRIIHSLSARKHNQFIAINCGAIPEGTINSELFGHEKGSFTGAMGDRKGYFETVDGGTIFLDEIGEMPLDTQAFLLRVLESGEFIRVGASKVQKTNVRVIAATNIDLLEGVRKGKFREDLYYRLSTVPIKVPALNERREDIALLFRKFVYDFSEKYHTPSIQLDDSAVKLLENYAWPGNIRELKNLAEQVSVLSINQLITAESLLKTMPHLANRNLPSKATQFEETQSFHERELLYKLLFDMKNDLNDLKALVFELIKSNDLRMPDTGHLRQMQYNNHNYQKQNNTTLPASPSLDYYVEDDDRAPSGNEYNSSRAIILDNQNDNYDKAEVVDESLSIDEMEKDMIVKALKKHNNRRKDAATDLGISERTLYRKIKQYELE